MRITNNMMSNMLLHNLNKNMFAMSQLQKQGSDGKRIHRPSDDAIGISKILKFKSDLSELDQYSTNIRDVLSWYQVTESAIVDLSSAVGRTRDLAVQAANTATNSPEELQKIKAEVMELRKHIVAAGNFNYAGKYVFSGYQNDKPLLKTEMVNGKEVVTYNVDITDRDVARPQKIRYAVGSAEQIQVTTNGLEIFGVVKNDYEDFDNVRFRLEGQFDFEKDYQNGTMTINVDGKRFVVDNSKLEGSIAKPLTKEDIIRVFKEAKYGKQKLSDIADIGFEQDNLIITSKKRGRVDMTFEHSGLNVGEEELEIGTARHRLEGTLDLSKDYSNGTIEVTIGSNTFDVDETMLVSPLSKEKVLDAFREAGTAGGKKLSEFAEVSYDNNKLVIKSLKSGAVEMSLSHTGTTPATQDTLAIEAKQAGEAVFRLRNKPFTYALRGEFKNDLDYTDKDITIRMGEEFFKVDTSTLDGTTTALSENAIVEAFKNATFNGKKLSELTNISYKNGQLTIENKTKYKNNMQVEVLDKKFNRTVDNRSKTISVSVQGKKYVVNTSSSSFNGTVALPIQEADIRTAFENARNSDGNLLKDVVDISFSDTGDIQIKSKPDPLKPDEEAINYSYKIESNVFKPKLIWKHEGYDYGEDIPLDHVVNIFGSMLTDSSGADFEEGVGVLQGRFDPEKDYTNDNLNIILGGKEYNVDERLLDGTKTPIDKALIIQRYRKAEYQDPNPPNTITKLEDVADVYFDEHDNLVIRAKLLKQNKLEADLTNNTIGNTAPNKPLIIEVDGKTFEVTDLTDEEAISKVQNTAGEYLGDWTDASVVPNVEHKGLINVNYDTTDPDHPKLTLTAKGYDNKKIEIKSLPAKEKHAVKLSSKRSNTDISSQSSIMKFSDTDTGISAKKAQLVGKFTLDGKGSDYRSSVLTFTVSTEETPTGGATTTTSDTFTVDTSELIGHGFRLKPEKVLDKIRNADNGSGKKLSQVADIFFNQNGELVVKHKEYDKAGTTSLVHKIDFAITAKDPTDPDYMPPEYTAEFEPGETAKTAKLVYDKFTFNDDFVKANEAKLKSTPIFVIYNGERHKINIDKEATFVDVDGYKGALQDAINKTIGEDTVKVSVVGTSPKQHLAFETVTTPDGVIPEIRVEPVVSNESTLIRDIDRFISALEDYDQDGINKFLADIDVHFNRILAVRADIGAKTNRMELAVERTKDNTLSFTEALSKVEDIDMAETIIQLKNFENVYKASLSMGSRIIQPSLVDFIR